MTTSRRPAPWRRCALVLVLAAAWMVLAVPAAVLAHAALVSSSPASGAVLSSPPTQLRLVFSEAPSQAGLSIRLFNRSGTEIPLGQPTRDPQFPTNVNVAIHYVTDYFFVSFVCTTSAGGVHFFIFSGG